ncbi:MAG: NADH-quinone oxidoreductase subunit J [Dermatophilaceae bacterium]
MTPTDVTLSAGESVFFWVVAVSMVAGGLGLLFARKAVYAAMSMALVMVLLGIVYLAQGADFLGIVHIFVYTGAVMMLFLFVIMLIGVEASESMVDTIRGQKVVALLVVLGLAGLLLSMFGQTTVRADPQGLAVANADGNPEGIASLVFGPYVWVFEITSALLITAAMASMVLAHRQRLVERPTQQELSLQRFRDNRFVAGLPAPGVYARHNAVDTPALLPDGTPSHLSVSRVLTARQQITGTKDYADAVDVREQEIEEGSQR